MTELIYIVFGFLLGMVFMHSYDRAWYLKIKKEWEETFAILQKNCEMWKQSYFEEKNRL